MQNDNATQDVAVQVALRCGTAFEDYPSIDVRPRAATG